jgi:hypothetical protein
MDGTDLNSDDTLLRPHGHGRYEAGLGITSPCGARRAGTKPSQQPRQRRQQRQKGPDPKQLLCHAQ